MSVAEPSLIPHLVPGEYYRYHGPGVGAELTAAGIEPDRLVRFLHYAVSSPAMARVQGPDGKATVWAGHLGPRQARARIDVFLEVLHELNGATTPADEPVADAPGAQQEEPPADALPEVAAAAIDQGALEPAPTAEPEGKADQGAGPVDPRREEWLRLAERTGDAWAWLRVVAPTAPPATPAEARQLLEALHLAVTGLAPGYLVEGMMQGFQLSRRLAGDKALLEWAGAMVRYWRGHPYRVRAEHRNRAT